MDDSPDAPGSLGERGARSSVNGGSRSAEGPHGVSSEWVGVLVGAPDSRAPGVSRVPRTSGMEVGERRMREWVRCPRSRMRGSGGNTGFEIVREPQGDPSRIKRTWEPYEG